VDTNCLGNQKPLRLVLLAAGGSRRFGSPKLLTEVEGVPLFWHALNLVSETFLRVSTKKWHAEIVVVMGANKDKMESSFSQWQKQRNEHIPKWRTQNHGKKKTNATQNLLRLTTVHNEKWDTGIASSIHAALDSLCWHLFVVADAPGISVNHLLRILEAAQETNTPPSSAQGAPIAYATQYEVDDTMGVPALFSPLCTPALLGLEHDTGASKLLRGTAWRVEKISTPCSLVDIDYPHELPKRLS
jgi:CTP:molybdopterin cytidylyltransferase MocA